MNSSSQPISLSDLKEQFKTLKLEFDKGHEPLAVLQDILRTLQYVKDNLASEECQAHDFKKYFFEEYIGGLTKRLSQIKFSQNDEYVHCISQIVMSLADLFAANISKDNSDFADSMRCLFDINSPLHQYMFQKNEKLLTDGDPNIFERLSEEEKEWRLSLNEGSKVDAIKIDGEYHLKQWSKGVISNMIGNGKYFQVKFENDFQKTTRDFTVYSSEIAKYNTVSEGDEWRSELKKGDIVDGYDNTKVWYTSTIIETEVRLIDDQEVPCVKLAFRQYHPNGNKTDNNSEAFYGWRETFDEWMSAQSPRIQKYQTFTKMQGYLASTSTNDEVCDDQLDNLLYKIDNTNQITYATERKKCGSTLLTQFVNYFGEHGGFQQILDRISSQNQEESSNIGLDLVFYYVDCIASCSHILTRPFLQKYSNDLFEAVRQKIIKANDAQLRNIKKDRMDQLVNLLINTIKSRFLVPKQKEFEKHTLNVEIGCVFLESNFMERRIDGAKLIHETCKSINNSLFSQSTEAIMNNSTRVQQNTFIAFILEKIRNSKVIFQFFSKERSHLELVQRSEELLKLLMGQGSLTHEELEQVWSCTKRGEEAIKLQMYKVLVEISSKMRASDIAFIIEQLSSKSTAIKEEVELVHEMARRTQNIELGKMAVEYLWKISMESNDKLDKALVNQAALSFSDIIKYWIIENKIQYIERLLKNIQNNKQGYQSMKNLIRIFKDFMNYSSNAKINDDINSEDLYGKPEDKESSEQHSEQNESQAAQQDNNSQSLLDYVNKKHDILSAFFSNFKDYTDRVRETIQKRIAENHLLEINTLADSCLVDQFCHSDQLSERLEFLKFVSGNSHQIIITQEMLTILWDSLATSLIQNDQEIFYRWLREAVELHSEGACIIDIDILVAFFKNKMIKDSKTMQYITPEGFNCISSLFILLNEQDKKIIKLNSSSGGSTNKITSFSNNGGSSQQQFSFNTNKSAGVQSSSDPEDYEISILVHPDDLEGISGIWKITIDSNDPKISEKATQLLIKLYTNIAYRNEHRIPEFEDCYLRRCIDGINEQIVIIGQRTTELYEESVKMERQLQGFSMTTQVTVKIPPPEEKKIVKYIQLIKELIKNSEKEGTHGLKPHCALFKGEYLHTIQVNNSLKNGNKYSTKIEIGCYSNTTLWELRRMIGEKVAQAHNADGTYVQELPVHPASIRIYRYTGSVDLKDYENGRTLAELRFKPNESLSAFKRNTYTSMKEPLLNEFRTDMSDKAKSIFEEWFNTFSEEDPDIPGHKVMTPRTCAAFARTCTDDNCTEEDNRVVGLFAMYDKDRDMKIQREDFLLFYKNCCTDKEEVVRQNLFANGYRYDLRKTVRDEDPEFIMQVRKSITDMPRYKVSSNPAFFETVFSLLQKQGEVSSQAWNLIKVISTNPSLYWKVLKLDKSPDFHWDQIFDSSSIYKMLYSLQIVESLLEQNRSAIDISTEEGQLKKDWIQRFLELDGFKEILLLFHKSIDLLSGKSADNLNKFEKNFLEFMLRLIKIFMMSAFSQNSQQNAFNMISLAKRSSSIKEEDAQNDKQDQNDEAYKTPSKQFKPTKLLGVAGIEAKKLYADFQPEINEDFLFPETSNADKPEPGQQEVQNSNKNDNSSAQQKEEGGHDIEQEMERFAELANVMKSTGLGERILEKIDFKELQDQVLEIVCIMISKKEITSEDKQIIENALSLWVASVIRNENLIDDFYNYKRSDEKAGKNGIKNAEEFILAGIYCYKNYRVREEIANTLQIICSKVKNNQGRPPLFYILNLLKNNFPKEDQYYATRECKQFFDLFSKLVDDYFNFGEHPKFEQDAIDSCELLREIVEKLKRHETKEKKTSILEDKTLCGYLELIQKLINYISVTDKAKMVDVLKNTLFLHELFYECLFYDPVLTQSSTGNKCKTKEARYEAFQLLAKYMQCLDPSDMADFLEQYLWPLMKDVKKPKKWCYTPNDSSRNSQFVGIVNLGCICYMNSMLQQFFMVPAFRYQLLRAIDVSPEDIAEYKGNKIDDSMLRQLQKLFGFLELSERQAYDPVEFCFSFKDMDGNPTNTSLQQDAQEFLSIFFDRVEELLRPTSQKHLLEDIFGFKLCSQLICQSCGNIRNLLESQYTLSLQVKDRKGIEDSMHKMIEGSIINDFQCEACNQRVDVFKRNLIAETPNVLIVHLQRIVFNFDTFQNDKINSRFEFPNILNLKDFSFREVMKSEGRPNEIMYSEEMKHLMDISDEEYTYKLVGVNIHVGTAEYGHYYSLINTKRGSEEVDEHKVEWTQTEKDTWKVFEDDKIKAYSFSDLRCDSFGGNQQSNMNENEMNAYLTNTGGSYGKNAYMLVYERMKKKQLTEIITNEDELHKVNVSLDCANTATSRAAAPQTTSNKRLLDFRKVTPYVPSWIKDKILEDNSSNLIDQHIFSEGFFNIVKSVFKHIADHVLLTQHRYGLDHIQYFNRIKKTTLKIARKSMFDLLAYFFQNTQMSDITSSFGSIIQFCDSAYSITRGDESLISSFIKDQYLADNCQSFLNLMFSCTDKTSRFYIAKMTTLIVNKAFSICETYQTQYEEEKLAKPDLERCERIVDLQESVQKLLYYIIIALQSQECQKSWMRLENYLKMIHEIGIGGKLQVNYLLTEFDIIVDLIDFMLGNKSPLAIQRGEKRTNMGSSMSSPPFESIVAQVSYLIRFSLTPEMKKEEQYWNDAINPPPTTLLGYIKQSDDYIEKYPLSDTALTFFTLPEFVDKVLKEGYECEEFGKALAHFCYKNESYTKRVCKMLLKGISKNDYEKIKNYLDVVTQVSLIHDEYQRQRLEWIFGISLLNSQSTYTTFNTSLNTTKLGIQVLDSQTTDEVYSFKSSLLPIDSDDALLNLLWRYKGRIDSYTVSCLQSLVNLLAVDENIAEYFAQLPGPTYSFARYTDWIKPYLHEQLLDARKGYHGSLSQSKEETVIKVLSLYEKYEQFLIIKDKVVDENKINNDQDHTYINVIQSNAESKDQETTAEAAEKQLDGYDVDEESSEENVRNLISKNVTNENQDSVNTGNAEATATKVTTYTEQHQTATIHCEPRPYIIIECIKEEQANKNNFDDVLLNISQLSCLYTMSYPTGKGNLSILKKQRNKNGGINIRSGQVISGKNREQELQSRCLETKLQFQGQNAREQEEPKEISVGQPLTVIHDENDQWAHVDNQFENSDSDREDRMNNISDDEDDRKDKSIMGQFTVYPQIGINIGNSSSGPQQEEPASFAIQVIEQKEEAFVEPKVVEDASEQDPEKGEANLGQVDEDDDDSDGKQRINWPFGVNLCQDLVYKIYVTNNRTCTVKCHLKLSEKEGQEYVNLNWPRGGVKAVVHPNQTKTLIILPKITPDNNYDSSGECRNPQMETSKLNISLFWKEKTRIENNSQVCIYPQPPSNSNITSSVNHSRRPGIMVQTGDSGSAMVDQDKPTIQLNLTSESAVYSSEAGIVTGNPGNSVEAPDGMKSCPQCTMFNEETALACEICGFSFC